MKIFSNFDTKLRYKELEKYQKEFWTDKVLLIWKSRLFKLVKIILPLIWLLIFILWFWYVLYYWLWQQALIYWWTPIIWLIVFFSLIPIIKKFIDFHMDFMLITPRLFIKYNQEWLFKRDYMTTYWVDIKSVIVRKKWILYSIFNVWDIIFLSEWDQEKTELSLNYVSDPEEKKAKIIEIKNYWEDMFMNNNENESIKSDL